MLSKRHIHTFFRKGYFSTHFLFFNTPFFQAFHFLKHFKKAYVETAFYSTENQMENQPEKTYIFSKKSRRCLHFLTFHIFGIHYDGYCYDLFNFIYFFFLKRVKSSAKKEIIHKIVWIIINFFLFKEKVAKR